MIILLICLALFHMSFLYFFDEEVSPLIIKILLSSAFLFYPVSLIDIPLMYLLIVWAIFLIIVCACYFIKRSQVNKGKQL